MLSLDIETTGLSTNTSHATIACTYDENNVSTTYHFWKPIPQNCSCVLPLNPSQRCPECIQYHLQNSINLFNALDQANTICGYNCVLFDIPFLVAQFHVPVSRASSWLKKCIDPFVFLTDSLGIYCKLSTLLHINGLDSKSSSGKSFSYIHYIGILHYSDVCKFTGKQAVDMAFNHQWDPLEEYCAKDAKLTRDLINLPKIKIPVHTIHGPNQTMEIEWNRDKFQWTIPIVPKKKVVVSQLMKKRTTEIPSLFE